MQRFRLSGFQLQTVRSGTGKHLMRINYSHSRYCGVFQSFKILCTEDAPSSNQDMTSCSLKVGNSGEYSGFIAVKGTQWPKTSS
jgi:hypothetical protein